MPLYSAGLIISAVIVDLFSHLLPFFENSCPTGSRENCVEYLRIMSSYKAHEINIMHAHAIRAHTTMMAASVCCLLGMCPPLCLPCAKAPASPEVVVRFVALFPDS